MGGDIRGKLYSETEDLTILRLRKAGSSWPEIGQAIGRSPDGARARFRDLTQGNARSGTGRHPSAPRGSRIPSFTPLPPIWEAMPEGVDDGAHVEKLRRLGGFTRRNQFSGAAA